MTEAASRTDIAFDSEGVTCRGVHVPAVNDGLAAGEGRPVVVMAHGFGGTVDSGLLGFADALAVAGVDVLAFDYRGFGASDGTPRQVISLAAQGADYRAAIRAAATLPGVDARRLVLWGTSLSGGTVLEVAAGRTDVAAVIALTPLVSGLAAARHSRLQDGRATASSARTLLLAARDKVGTRSTTVPLVGRPGEPAVLSLPGAYEDYLSIAGPTWRNEVGAAIAVDVLARSSASSAAQVKVPVLVQVADLDRLAPPHAAMKVAVAARAHVRHYPCDHFDVYPGKAFHELVVAHQMRFLTRSLAAGTQPG